MDTAGTARKAAKHRVGGLFALAIAMVSGPAFAAGTLSQISPEVRNYVFAINGDFTEFFGPANADVTASLFAVALTFPPTPLPTSTSGCSASDFTGFVAGSIALMERGGCTPGEKAINAANAGAVGALIFNEGQPGRTAAMEFGYAGFEPSIPTFNLSFALGADLAAAMTDGPVTVRMTTDGAWSVAPLLASVPEPATWATMILGFGFAGSVLRRRRAMALAPLMFSNAPRRCGA